MQPSWRLALNALAGRRLRTVLMAGAVATATSLVVAVSCATASAQSGFESSLVRFIGASDCRIIHPGNGRFDAALLETVRGWPEVRLATGRLVGSLTLQHADGRIDPETGRPRRVSPRAVGIDFDREEPFRPIALTAGRVPRERDEILIDPLTAEALETGVGDTLEVFRAGPPIRLHVAGIYERRKLAALQHRRIYVARGLLAELMDRVGTLTSIQIILREGEEVEPFCARHLAALPESVTLEPAEMVRTGFDQRVSMNRLALTVISVLTFLCAAFIILVGLTTGVTEREREMGLLRCLGATRRQVFGSQVLVGGYFGVMGGLLGAPLGLALTQTLAWIYPDYLPDGVKVDRFGLGLALGGAVAAGLAGALYPAVVASRVTPLRAMTAAARAARPRQVVACGLLGLALVGVQLALYALPDDEDRFWAYVWVGLPVLFVGWFLLAVPTLLAVTATLVRPLSRALRLPPDMLRGSMLATPLRHGFTAGALMVGMAVLVDTWATGVSIQDDWLARIRFPDGFAMRVTGISPDAQQRIADLPFVDEVCPIGYLPARLVGRQVFGVKGLAPANVVCIAFDPHRFFRMNAVEWAQGDPERAIARLVAGDGAIVAEAFLVAKDVGVGERITLGVGRVTREFEIVGVVSAAGLDLATQLFGIRSQYTEFAVSCVFVDWSTVVEVFDSTNAYILQVNLNDEVDEEEATQRIMEAAPGVSFFSGRWIVETIDEMADALLIVNSTVAFAALLLAALAVGHVISAGIQGRRYEFGVLRSVGAGRGTLVRVILAESALLAVTGALVGTLFGFHLAWIDVTNVRNLAGVPLEVAWPGMPMVAGWVVHVTVTVGAAVPAALGVARGRPSRMLAVGRNA
jgi:putative ABC transport system permease protein